MNVGWAYNVTPDTVSPYYYEKAKKTYLRLSDDDQFSLITANAPKYGMNIALAFNVIPDESSPLPRPTFDQGSIHKPYGQNIYGQSKISNWSKVGQELVKQ